MDLDCGGLWNYSGGCSGGCMEAIVSKYNNTASEIGMRRSWLTAFLGRKEMKEADSNVRKHDSIS